jgi:outer membrane protein OmpA-like peptidoglycan-associated protein
LSHLIMSKSKPTKEEKDYRLQIIVAIIALVGTLSAALLANLDKLRNITNSNANQAINTQADLPQNIANSNTNNISTSSKTISLEFLQEQLRPIYFEFDEGNPKLSENNMRILDDYILLINQCNFIIVIEGHTDSEDPDTNTPLSRRIATLVYAHMLDKGISGKRLSVVSFGGERNIKPEKSPYNRRVEFKVLKDSAK